MRRHKSMTKGKKSRNFDPLIKPRGSIDTIRKIASPNQIWFPSERLQLHFLFNLCQSWVVNVWSTFFTFFFLILLLHYVYRGHFWTHIHLQLHTTRKQLFFLFFYYLKNAHILKRKIRKKNIFQKLKIKINKFKARFGSNVIFILSKKKITRMVKKKMVLPVPYLIVGQT